MLVASLVGFGALSSYLSEMELTIVRALVLGIVELTFTLSDAVAPVSFINVSIAVCESTNSVLLALGEGPFINAAVWGFELPLALLLIILELAYVDAIFVFKSTVAVLHAVIPVAIVLAAVGKGHLPSAMGIVRPCFADVDISLGEDRPSVATLLVLGPVTLVELACALESDTSSVAVCSLVLCLANIRGSGLSVVPDPIFLNVTDFFGRVYNILVVVIFFESLVSLFDDWIKFCKDSVIHASEFIAIVSSGVATSYARSIPWFLHICAMK